MTSMTYIIHIAVKVSVDAGGTSLTHTLFHEDWLHTSLNGARHNLLMQEAHEPTCRERKGGWEWRKGGRGGREGGEGEINLISSRSSMGYLTI